MQRTLITVGLLIALIGLLWPWISKHSRPWSSSAWSWASPVLRRASSVPEPGSAS